MFWPSPKTTSPIASPSHPYYPVGVEIANYLANETDCETLIAIFAVGCIVVLISTWVITVLLCPVLRQLDKWTILWFVTTGSIHLFFEGYFAVNHENMAPAQDVFGQLWKEYSYSDSRYLWSEPFVVTMESITALLWGPLSFLTAYMVATESPFRHPLQALVSTGQLYGDVLYLATSLFQHYVKNVSYCRPEPIYFWFYFVFTNSVWIVIPGLLLWQSISTSAHAFRALDRMAQSLKASKKARENGSLQHH